LRSTPRPDSLVGAAAKQRKKAKEEKVHAGAPPRGPHPPQTAEARYRKSGTQTYTRISPLVIMVPLYLYMDAIGLTDSLVGAAMP